MSEPKQKAAKGLFVFRYYLVKFKLKLRHDPAAFLTSVVFN